MTALVPWTGQCATTEPAMTLRMQRIEGNLTFTANAVTAWYELPEQVWAFQSDASREVTLTAVAGQYAGLAGTHLHLRRTTRPYPVKAWAAGLARQARPLDRDDFDGHLRTAVVHLDAAEPTEGLTLLGVTVPRREFGDVILDWLRALRGTRQGGGDQTRLDVRIAKITELLAPYGLDAEPATPTDLAWMIYRSVGLGLTPPDRRATTLDADDMLALTDHVDRHPTPYGSTVRYVNRLSGEERHVAVLTVGRMEPQRIPEEHQPWLHLAEQVPWPVEISSRVQILDGDEAGGSLQRKLLTIRSQQRDYADHDLDSPPELARLAERALHVGDQVATGLPVDAARAHGRHRLAVAGATQQEALERATELARLYSERSRISLQHTKNQAAIATEFIPGEPVVDNGYLRRMPVRLLAAAVPQAVNAVGDGRGDLIGWTGQRPVMFDPHFPMEVRERSGLAVLVAEPGGGKSTLMGSVAYLAALRGVQATVMDPSGPLASLAAMPQMRGRARVVDLVGQVPGTLAPYALIPTPRRDQFTPDGEGGHLYDIALKAARAERKMLVLDVASMLLPAASVRRDSVVGELRGAIRRVPAEETSTLDDVVQVLLDGTPEAKNVAELLLDAAELPMAQLLFGRAQGDIDSNAPLTVITMGGLRLPDMSIERDYWSAEEAMALPMLHLANRLAVRRCYSGDPHRRKLVGLDEAHVLEGWPSGRAFLVRLARDSRKFNLAALVASQNPGDILGLDVQNLVSTVFVGRVADEDKVAADALRLLRLPAGAGYETVVAALSQSTAGTGRLGYREFVMRDVDRRVQTIRVDVSYAEGLLAHLDTTPGGVA